MMNHFSHFNKLQKAMEQKLIMADHQNTNHHVESLSIEYESKS
jgi:hypothetical protein